MWACASPAFHVNVLKGKERNNRKEYTYVKYVEHLKQRNKFLFFLFNN